MCARKPDFDIARLFARGNPHLRPEECAAYEAPFPDSGHRAGLRAFPPMVPERPDADGAAVSRQAREFLQRHPPALAAPRGPAWVMSTGRTEAARDSQGLLPPDVLRFLFT